MHRTKIVALALLGAAVSAASGCVAVPPHGPPASTPPPGPSGTPGRHAQDTGPQIVQGPPVEALETVPPGPGSGTRAAAAPSARRPDDGTGPGGGTGTGPAPARHTVRPARPRTAAHPRTAGPAHPAPPAPAPRPKHVNRPSGTAANVCALGEGYGHWQPDSPQARICHQTYGR
ncbi:hypothetical protein [Streptomyces sp. NBC_01089]|uniref:hypothetical protein n=1 Tax=Streptomyces sp. NBC_01089 TaxID=2903747 RepID=UPI00386EA2F3|nr:hypothetical protein OG510_33200 [Streptomyces sp. NBC_01089]